MTNIFSIAIRLKLIPIHFHLRK